MFSFRRLALLLALSLPAILAVQAQSSSSNPATPNQDPAQQPAADAQTPGQISVQARIKARREQRRAAAIQEAYSHRYDAYANMGYLRFSPGAHLQRVTYYAWDTGLTRYFSNRLGVSLDGRGYYGTPFVGLNPSGITKPAISTYTGMIGPTYRFYLQPKYSVALRALGGYAWGNFSSDTNGFGSVGLGMYPDGGTFAASASAIVEFNVTPNVAARVAPEYFATGFGSSMQNSLGFTGGIVYRFGKR